MKRRYYKLFDAQRNLQNREQLLVKQARSISNEILAEKLSLEKTKFDEIDQNQRARLLEDERDAMQLVSHVVEVTLVLNILL